MVVVELPAAAASLSDRVRVLRWGIVAAGEPRISEAVSPHLLFIGCATGAHQPRLGLGPRSGRKVKGPVGRCQLVEINSNKQNSLSVWRMLLKF